MLSAENRVADMQRAVLHQDARRGAETDLHLRFEHGSGRAPFRIGLELEDLRFEQDAVQQIRESLAGFG